MSVPRPNETTLEQLGLPTKKDGSVDLLENRPLDGRDPSAAALAVELLAAVPETTPWHNW